jgi:hypothetical protein
VAYGGLEPLVRLAERCGLPSLIADRVRLPVTADGIGAFPAAKVMALVAGMAAGAGSIADMDRLRHGAMDRLFDGVCTPLTLGSFLRAWKSWADQRLPHAASGPRTRIPPRGR